MLIGSDNYKIVMKEIEHLELSKSPEVGDYRIKVYTQGVIYSVSVQQYVQFLCWRWWSNKKRISDGWDVESRIGNAKDWIDQRIAKKKTRYINYP